MNKRQNCENRYGIVFFVGNYESAPELKRALHDEEIVVSRGIQLEKLIEQLLTDSIKRGDSQKPNLAIITQ